MLIDSLTNLNSSTRNTVFGALIIIAAIAMYNWIVNPHINHLHAAQQYAAVVGKAEEKNKTAVREIKAKTKKLEKLYAQLAEVRGALSTPDEAKEFFSSLQDLAEETGCTVKSLNLATREPSDNKRNQPKRTSGIVANSATLTVSGQYDDIIRLVEKLQNRAKRIWMDSFRIETVDSKSDLLKCDMTIIVYTAEEEPVL
jgi:Tfp pilus assembly protein PilO